MSKSVIRLAEKVTELMTQLVAIPSVFPQEQAVAHFLEKYLVGLGFSVQRVPAEANRESLVATFGQTDHYVCFYGHMDTVPADPLYQQDPWQVQIEKGIAHGLGVTDMKGGIAAILVAAQYAVEHDLPMKIALGVDEENISLGSQTLVQTDFFRDVVFLVSAESGQIFDENQEFSVNYGRKGRFVLEVEISGQVAHAARSDQAVNAITQATKFLASLSQLQLPTHAHLGKTEIIPFFIHGETDSFSIPARATLRLNILSVPGVTSQSMIAKLDKIAAAEKIDAQVSLVARPTPYMEAYEVDLADPIITQFEATVLAGTKVKPGYAISVADENRFAHALNIPVISLGPIGGGDHTAQEWVSVDSLQQTVQAYQKILELFEQKQ